MVVGGRATAQQADARLERLDAATRPTVAALLDSARTAMLPTEPLVQRALEGATKRASGDAIVTAVRRLAADLGHARDALGSTASPAELTAGAAALRAGASQGTLADLRHARREPLTVPLAVLADLVASGVPVDSATAAVLGLAARARDADLVEFRRAVERDIALGAPPAAATAAAVTAAGVWVNAGGPPAAPRPPLTPCGQRRPRDMSGPRPSPRQRLCYPFAPPSRRPPGPSTSASPLCAPTPSFPPAPYPSPRPALASGPAPPSRLAAPTSASKAAAGVCRDSSPLRSSRHPASSGTAGVASSSSRRAEAATPTSRASGTRPVRPGCIW